MSELAMGHEIDALIPTHPPADGKHATPSTVRVGGIEGATQAYLTHSLICAATNSTLNLSNGHFC